MPLYLDISRNLYNTSSRVLNTWSKPIKNERGQCDNCCNLESEKKILNTGYRSI